MKEPLNEVRPSESPEERKRRLARERQRRHRQKLRARPRVLEDTPTAAVDQPVIATATRPTDHVESESLRRSGLPTPVTSAIVLRRPITRKPPHNESAVDDIQAVVDVGQRAAKSISRNSERVLKAAAAAAEKAASAACRSGRQDVNSQINAAAAKQKQLQHHHQQQQQGQEHQEERQELQKQKEKLQFHSQQQQQCHQSQHQQPHHPRPPHPQRHHPLPEHNPLSQQALQQQQHQQQQHQNHQFRQRHKEPQQQTHPQQQLQHQGHRAQDQQRQYNQRLLMEQHAATFPSGSHAFSPSQQPHTSQPHHQHNEPAFAFSTQPDPSVAHHAYVTDPHRSYVQETPMHMGMTNRQHFPRFSTPRARQNSHVTLTADADAAAGLTALPAAVNGMHESLASTANVVPNSTANGLAVPRDTHTARLAQSASIASAGLSQQTSPTQLQVSRDASGTEDPFVQNVVESSEERKRRLARERQRRRRKRLKKNNGGTVKGELDAIQRTADEAPRNGAGGTTGVVTSTLDLPLHVRGGDGGIHGHAPGQIGSNLPSQFEGVNLTSGHHVQTSLQPLQVGGAQEELTAAAAASARGSAFNAHTLGVGNVNASPPVSSVGLVGHQNTGELQRMVTNSEEKRGREQYHNEDSGTRKRRLARDRQRRRRDRLRLKKSGGNDRIDKSPSNSQTMKNAVDGSSGRLMDGELGEADRMPLGSGNSGVFGGRGDVAAQTLSFGDQGRGMRGGGPMGDGTVAGMGISFVTNGGLNLPNMHVGAMGGSGPHNVLHWSHAFESESSARFAVDSAVSAFRAQIAGRNINARNYVIQQGILTLSGTEDASRDMMNGQMMNSLRADGVMRI